MNSFALACTRLSAPTAGSVPGGSPWNSPAEDPPARIHSSVMATCLMKVRRHVYATWMRPSAACVTAG